MPNTRVILTDLKTKTKAKINSSPSNHLHLKAKTKDSIENQNTSANTITHFSIEEFPKSPLMSKETKFTLKKKIIKLNNINEDKNYLNYGLHRNLNSNPSSPSDILHRYLPLKYKNNEKYKEKLLKYLRLPKNPNCKTDFCKLPSNYSITNEASCFDGNITKYEKENELKRKEYFSVKKGFSEHPFYTETNEPNRFYIYTDNDIGFDKKWQQQLQTAEMDDDVCTDSEQLCIARYHINNEINQGIQNFAKNKRKVRNYNRYHENHLLN